ncbi:MAG: hypothetical protein ACI4WX_07655 [Aristaeellaceae bacterium]
MKVKELPIRMTNEKQFRDEAEKMLGKKWDDMKKDERVFCATVLSAVNEIGDLGCN